MKFGFEVPHTVKETLELDRTRNGNTFRADAIKKELDSVRVAIEILGKDNVIPLAGEFQNHLLFDL
jgi:hypothetical protein